MVRESGSSHSWSSGVSSVLDNKSTVSELSILKEPVSNDREKRVMDVLQKRKDSGSHVTDRVAQLDKKLNTVNSEVEDMYNLLKSRLERTLNRSDSTSVSMSKVSKKRSDSYLSSKSNSEYRGIFRHRNSGERTNLNSPEPSEVNLSMEDRVAALEKGMFSIGRNVERIAQQLASGNPRNSIVAKGEKETVYGCQEIMALFQKTSSDLGRVANSLSILHQMPVLKTRNNLVPPAREEIYQLHNEVVNFAEKMGNSMAMLNEKKETSDHEGCIVCG